MIKDHQNIRQEFWCQVYIAYVNASNSTTPRYAKDWADTALEEFDKRFKDSECTEKSVT